MKKEYFLNEINVNYSKKTVHVESIKDSFQAYNLLREIYLETNAAVEVKEYFYFLLLNRSNEVTSYMKLSEGGITCTIVDLRILIGTALKCLASGIILCHNHPSGNLEPSDSDKDLTKRITHACKLFDIKVLDHIILTSTDFYSFSDNGLM